MCDRRGFTLIEVLAAIAFISVLVAILLPSLTHARAGSRHVNFGGAVTKDDLSALVDNPRNGSYGYDWATFGPFFGDPDTRGWPRRRRRQQPANLTVSRR